MRRRPACKVRQRGGEARTVGRRWRSVKKLGRAVHILKRGFDAVAPLHAKAAGFG